MALLIGSAMDTNDLADRLEQFYEGTHISKAAEVLREQDKLLKEAEKDIFTLMLEINRLNNELNK
jgi:hypothetical protein